MLLMVSSEEQMFEVVFSFCCWHVELQLNFVHYPISSRLAVSPYSFQYLRCNLLWLFYVDNHFIGK